MYETFAKCESSEFSPTVVRLHSTGWRHPPSRVERARRARVNVIVVHGGHGARRVNKRKAQTTQSVLLAFADHKNAISASTPSPSSSTITKKQFGIHGDEKELRHERVEIAKEEWTGGGDTIANISPLKTGVPSLT